MAPDKISKGIDKVKVGPRTNYNQASSTYDQQCNTISEMAADWHRPELMVPQCIHCPNIWTCGAVSRHIIAPVSHTIAFAPIPATSGQLLVIRRPAKDRRLSWPGHMTR